MDEWRILNTIDGDDHAAWLPTLSHRRDRRGSLGAKLGSSAVKKQEMLDMLERLPDEIDPEQLMHDLYLRAKLEDAEAAVAKGSVVAHEDVVKRSQQWFE
ncbi:MAG: hypothetical protein NTW96_26570 [Planctomycetia bacterium]|nr:hypothetical protein [Planctomycetia bacterium]